MTPLESRLAGALWRVYQKIDALVERAHAERRAMFESAQRSMGQRFRWARRGLTPPPHYMPAVFRWRNCNGARHPRFKQGVATWLRSTR